MHWSFHNGDEEDGVRHANKYRTNTALLLWSHSWTELLLSSDSARMSVTMSQCDMLKDFNYLDKLNLPTNGISDDITLICEAES